MFGNQRGLPIVEVAIRLGELSVRGFVFARWDPNPARQHYHACEPYNDERFLKFLRDLQPTQHLPPTQRFDAPTQSMDTGADFFRNEVQHIPRPYEKGAVVI